MTPRRAAQRSANEDESETGPRLRQDARQATEVRAGLARRRRGGRERAGPEGWGTKATDGAGESEGRGGEGRGGGRRKGEGGRKDRARGRAARPREEGSDGRSGGGGGRRARREGGRRRKEVTAGNGEGEERRRRRPRVRWRWAVRHGWVVGRWAVLRGRREIWVSGAGRSCLGRWTDNCRVDWLLAGAGWRAREAVCGDIARGTKGRGRHAGSGSDRVGAAADG